MTVSGKIRSSALYDVSYDIACDAMLSGRFPTLTLRAGKLGLRVVDSALTIGQACTIPLGQLDEHKQPLLWTAPGRAPPPRRAVRRNGRGPPA
jgi:hypothetical protein